MVIWHTCPLDACSHRKVAGVVGAPGALVDQVKKSMKAINEKKTNK
jgi:hypothetical protein